jgi:hypothetical protein
MKSKLEFIAQTQIVNYYREEDETIWIYSRLNNKCIQGGVMAENDLLQNIIDNSIIKISEHFVYDYVEILRSEIEATEEPSHIEYLESLIENVNRLLN